MASVVTIELKPGEKDAKNVAYHTLVLEAWDMVQDHDVFKKITSENPWKSTPAARKRLSARGNSA